MGNIDVTEVLVDPDFVDPIQLITRVPFVNLYGENSFENRVINSIGCVQPASGKTVSKLPEAMRVANISSFWFKGQITASAPGLYPSVLVFKSTRYQVQTVNDWSNWGAGWCEGTCIAEVPAP